MELAKYKACICEGAAEAAIIDSLLDNGLLIFEREEMIREEGSLNTLYEMVDESVITVQYAAKKAYMSEDEFLGAMKEWKLSHKENK